MTTERYLTHSEMEECKAILSVRRSAQSLLGLNSDGLPGLMIGDAAPDQILFLIHYARCIADGSSPKLADMFAAAQPPYGKSDCTFMADSWGGMSGVHDECRAYYKKMAAAAGVQAEGKQYIGGLARFPGDPTAWVDSADQIKTICKKRGWGCQGTVNVETPNMGRIPKRKGGNIKDRFQKAGLPSRPE